MQITRSPNVAVSSILSSALLSSTPRIVRLVVPETRLVPCPSPKVAAPQVAQKNYEERVARASLQLDLAKRTRDYNMGTSLKNYIDPSVYKTWGDHVGYDWKRLYTKALQRKFAWVEHVRARWKTEET